MRTRIHNVHMYATIWPNQTPLSIAAVNKHLKCVEALIPLIPPLELTKQFMKAEAHVKDKNILQALKVYKGIITASLEVAWW